MGIENISPETRALIDEQLFKMAQINAGMGVDTKADERIECRRQINICLKRIKELDLEFWEQIVSDKNEPRITRTNSNIFLPFSYTYRP